MGIKSKIKRKFKKPKIQTYTDMDGLTEELRCYNGEVRCLIVNQTVTPCVYDYKIVPSGLIPEGSVPFDDGGLTHWLKTDGKTFFPLFDRSTVETKPQSPISTFMTGWWPGLRRIIHTKTEITEKIKLGVFIGLAFALVIVLFMLSVVALGG